MITMEFFVHTPIYPNGLPTLESELLPILDQNHAYLSQLIEHNQGFLPYDQWMQAALYAPNVGYYSGGSTKFHTAGDFTTAPEISPLFGQTLAVQIQEVLAQCDTSAAILEFGAGSGALADSVLAALADEGINQVPYYILELSPSLRARQQQRLASYGDRVQWLDALPTAFTGCVIANEVLDAMPVHLMQRNNQGELLELGVGLNNAPQANTPSPFALLGRPATGALQGIAEQRLPNTPGYRSEINLQAEAWIREMGQWLHQGAALLIDYGFPAHEYYHSQRHTGTLMCHFRHFAHDESLILAGLQDITAHVDFTAMADAALEGGLDVIGYTSQAHFLMNSGITHHLEQLHALLDRNNPVHLQSWARQTAAVQQLLSEAEMGELFKVLALGKNLTAPLSGFALRDRRDSL